MSDEKTIEICPNHQDYPTPMLATLAFRGAELWCPHCGHTTGMFGDGIEVPDTKELKERSKKHSKHAKEFLHAMGVRACYKTTWQGNVIFPDELPQEEKDRLEKIRKEWEYGKKF